jgi:hypothetical protein
VNVPKRVVWSEAKAMRTQLNELVRQFSAAATAREQRALLEKAQVRRQEGDCGHFTVPVAPPGQRVRLTEHRSHHDRRGCASRRPTRSVCWPE